jgi:hypothetical protein
MKEIKELKVKNKKEKTWQLFILISEKHSQLLIK